MVAKQDISTVVASLLLAVLCALAFGGALQCDFVRLDDDHYVFENPHVLPGVTTEGVRWAFTEGYASNWHPLTWLSHMADVDLYGLEPAGHHATNLLLHMANAILLFWILRRMTGSFFLSWLVAAIWAVHPLRAESVVWISERKDVLAMFFGLLAVWTYGQLNLRGRMGWVALAFAMSLMSKALWVTLPFLLLLLDGWPLKRWPEISVWKLVKEKGLLFLLAGGACAITYWAQVEGGSVSSLHSLSLSARVSQAAVAYVEYVRLLFWPFGLAVLYPLSLTGYSIIRTAGSFALLLILSLAAVWQFRRRPWLTIGWLWFIGSLVPMIGLVQVGGQSWADRYTYLSHMGLLLALVWAGGCLWASRIGMLAGPARPSRPEEGSMKGSFSLFIPSVVAAVLILPLIMISQRQTTHWRTTEQLFQRAIAVTENNALVHGNLGMWYVEQGREGEGLDHLRHSLDIQSKHNKARVNLANALLASGNKNEAVQQYLLGVEDFPDVILVLNNLAWLLATHPDATPQMVRQAVEHAERAAELTRGESASILDTVGVAQAAAGDYDGAIEASRKALQLLEGKNKPDQEEGIRSRIRLYQEAKPYRE